MTKPKFKIDDHVRVKTSQKTGYVRAVYDADYWNLWTMDGGDHEYGIEYDDGSGTCNIVEKVLELSDSTPVYPKRCSCGAWITSFPDNHSAWCDLFIHDATYASNYTSMGNGD